MNARRFKSPRHVELEASFPNVAPPLTDKSAQPSLFSWGGSDLVIVLLGIAALAWCFS
jgi:hypothetical protein